MLRPLITISMLIASAAAFSEHRMISVGNRRLSIDCDGKPAGSATVVLMAGGGRTARDWQKVQPAVSGFTRVCSYDRAGFGESDKADVKVQSLDDVVEDLHQLLEASGEKGPFILVAHSVVGVYARGFVTKFPREVAGLVFVDSSHEEQALRIQELDPQEPGPGEGAARQGFLVKPGSRLEWRTELPLIVIAHGKPFPRTKEMTEEQWAAWDRIWRGFQEDLAKRSTHGELRVAAESGHLIQRDQPEYVIQAIRDVSRAQ